MTTTKHVLDIHCSSCGQSWTDQHRCPVPPTIDTTRYTDEALRHLVDYLSWVLEGRAKAAS